MEDRFAALMRRIDEKYAQRIRGLEKEIEDMTKRHLAELEILKAAYANLLASKIEP